MLNLKVDEANVHSWIIMVSVCIHKGWNSFDFLRGALGILFKILRPYLSLSLQNLCCQSSSPSFHLQMIKITRSSRLFPPEITSPFIHAKITFANKKKKRGAPKKLKANLIRELMQRYEAHNILPTARSSLDQSHQLSFECCSFFFIPPSSSRWRRSPTERQPKVTSVKEDRSWNAYAIGTKIPAYINGGLLFSSVY